jgi:hypothetical protein
MLQNLGLNSRPTVFLLRYSYQQPNRTVLSTVGLDMIQSKLELMVVSCDLKSLTIFLDIHLHTHEYTLARQRSWVLLVYG